MDAFNPWTLFVDVGIVSILLLIGKFLRVKVKLIQQLFIPPSILAGFLGLLLGSNGLGWIPLSNQTGTYAGILIALIFSTLPFSSQKMKKEDRASIGSMWAYSQAGMCLQWAFGGLLGLLLLSPIWGVESAFGITMPAGFIGGHGSAAALGQAFSQLGHDDILTLAMTAATFGIIAAVVLGLVIIKWGTRKGNTSFLTDFKNLPPELRTGLLPFDKQEPLGTSTCSSISIDSLTFSLSVICGIALGGYGLSQLAKVAMPDFELPVFSCAFIIGILAKFLLDKANVTRFVCKQTVGHLGGSFTDYLVAFGIASIKISVVVEYAVPLVILLLCGLLATLVYVILMGRKLMKDHWFEKAIFTWGWFMGTMAMGIALLRVVDPKMRSRCLDTYAIAYLFIAPIEIALITFAPVAFISGNGLLFSGICLAGGIAVLAVAKFKGWFVKSPKL